MIFKEVVRLFRAKRSGNWKGKPAYQAKCPSHRDRSPSLSITEGANGATYLHCFRGCTTEEILSAKGMRMGDLFADSGFKPSPEMRRVWADEDVAVGVRTEQHGYAFADTRPKIPRGWGRCERPGRVCEERWSLGRVESGPYWGGWSAIKLWKSGG